MLPRIASRLAVAPRPRLDDERSKHGYSERTSRQPRGLAKGVDRALSARAEPRSNPGRSMTRLIHSLLGAIPDPLG